MENRKSKKTKNTRNYPKELAFSIHRLNKFPMETN